MVFGNNTHTTHTTSTHPTHGTTGEMSHSSVGGNGMTGSSTGMGHSTGEMSHSSTGMTGSTGHVSMGNTHSGVGITSHKPTMGEKISGSVESMVGKATNNPVKIAEGEMKKGNQVNVTGTTPRY